MITLVILSVDATVSVDLRRALQRAKLQGSLQL